MYVVGGGGESTDLNRELSKEDTKMSKKYLLKANCPLVVKAMQI